MTEEITNRLFGAVNAHDIKALMDLFDLDAPRVDYFLDPLAHTGGLAARWEALFDLFPDFNVQIDESSISGSILFAKGTATGSVKNAPHESFNTEFLMRLEVFNARISRFFCSAAPGAFDDIILRHGHIIQHKNAVNGLGGVFIKSDNPQVLCAWYDENLGTRFRKESSTYFKWQYRSPERGIGSTSFAIFNSHADYFAPSSGSVMLNFRVADLDGLIDRLRSNNVVFAGEPEVFDYGKFAWIMDPDGNKIELWSPIDRVLDDWEKNNTP